MKQNPSQFVNWCGLHRKWLNFCKVFISKYHKIFGRFSFQSSQLKSKTHLDGPNWRVLFAKIFSIFIHSETHSDIYQFTHIRYSGNNTRGQAINKFDKNHHISILKNSQLDVQSWKVTTDQTVNKYLIWNLGHLVTTQSFLWMQIIRLHLQVKDK